MKSGASASYAGKAERLEVRWAWGDMGKGEVGKDVALDKSPWKGTNMGMYWKC